MGRLRERQEEIQKLIDEEMGIDNYGSSDFQVGVCYGVRHADKTMIEKSCEWMMNFKNAAGEFPLYDYVGDFRKAMEK